MPIPMTILNTNKSHCGIGMVSISGKGANSSVNMIMALVYNFQFPVLLILFSLK
jgi:hypothetical protein